MKRIVSVAFLTGILLFLPSSTRADHTSLVWGGQGSGVDEVVIVDGGTYTVSLNTQAPVYYVPPPFVPDSGIVPFIATDLHRINAEGQREFVETIFAHQMNPNDPESDVLFTWPSAGTYELDVLAMVPPPSESFEHTLRRWLANVFFADLAHAQESDEPVVLETLHFTIVDANAEPDPVIIIPGILGSEQHNGEWVIDPILHTYDDLIATLDANGYTPDQDLFPFPYNWRKSNVDTALLLKEKIDEVKDTCDCDKVDLVAHSMGGLVARQYIQSDDYEDDVDQLVFLGTPHLGAPKAYLMWEGGEFAAGLRDRGLEVLLGHEAAEEKYPTLFAYLRTEPIEAVRELLSVESYLFDGNNARQYPNNYPTNTFLESLNASVDSLLGAGVRIYNFVGETTSQDTITEIHVVNTNQYTPMWGHGYPQGFYENSGNPGLVEGRGDETVPLTSASFIVSNLVVTPYEHITLPAQMEGEIYEILTGKIAGTLVQRFINIPNFRLLLIKILSPADLLVIAPDGKKIGKNLNGQEINQIPNAFYTGFNTDTEFITILNPLNGEYKIYTQGTASGPYTVETSLINNATTTDASFTGNTAPGLASQLNLSVQNSSINPSSLQVVVTYDSTLADLERIYGLKWVNVGVYKALKAQLQIVKKSRPLIAKPLLQAMLKQLQQYRGKLITEQGYQILKEDIESLIKT